MKNSIKMTLLFNYNSVYISFIKGFYYINIIIVVLFILYINYYRSNNFLNLLIFIIVLGEGFGKYKPY